MLKHCLRKILHFLINIFNAVSNILCYFWTTDKAWFQSQQMPKYFNGKIQLGGLLHLYVLHRHSFLVVIQEDIRLDNHSNSPSFISLYEVLRYQCKNVSIKMWVLNLENKAFGKRPLVQAFHGTSRFHLYLMSSIFPNYYVFELQPLRRPGQHSRCFL
jgi:hypothetical protein